MSSLVSILVRQKKLILTTATLLALFGLMSWFQMNRQEDPFFPYRNGFILTQYPGADVNRIEKQVLKPMEEELAQVEEIKEIRSTVRAGFVQVIISMHEYIYDTDTVWDKVRRAVDRAQLQFPDGVQTPTVEDRLTDTTVAVYAISGDNNIIALRKAAKEIKNRLFTLNGVGKVEFFGMPEEQISIVVDQAELKKLDITHEFIAQQISDRTKVVPINSLHAGSRRINIDAHTEFSTLEELSNAIITLPDDTHLPLSSIAKILYEPATEASSAFWDGQTRGIAMGVYIPDNIMNVVEFGHSLRGFMDKIRAEYPQLNIDEMFFQPDRVDNRIAELGQSLLTGMFFVTIILAFFLGLRPGLVVALIIPLVTFSSLAVFNLGGGVLHQMVIAGMVIGLGMLVDNAIVMVENIQFHMDRGERGSVASVTSVKQLAMSLGSATGTTIAAFMPMLLSEGNAADFTRGIAVMIILSITVSYLYAIMVTPAFSHLFLKPRTEQKTSFFERLGSKLGHIATARPNIIGVTAMLFVAVSLYLFNFVQKDFFPDTDRNQIVVDLTYPESVNINHNAEQSRLIADQIAEYEDVQRVMIFVGNSGPTFYYNLIEKPRAPHVTRIVAIIDDVERSAEFTEWVEREVEPNYPEITILARKLGQGPPVEYPVEIKVFSQDRAQLANSVRSVQQLLLDTPGTRGVNNNIGLGMPSVDLIPRDDLLNRNDMTRDQLAAGIALRTAGRTIGQYRGSEDPINIVMQSPDNIRFPIDDINDLEINSNGEVLNVRSLMEYRYRWLPASIQHENLQRTASIFSETQSEYTYADVMAIVEPQLEQMEWPAGVSYKIGGDAKESGEANSSLGNALPIGVILLLIFLLMEFNSYRKVLIILITVPLAFAGVPLGLLLTGTTFGFTATLGVLALIGIVVNNAIVLLDLIHKNTLEGLPQREAIREAVARRTRPILLTTFTTVAGLLPLVMTKSTLWPPLAWSIISGLIVSTALSLLVVPALYQKMIKH